MSRFLGGIGRAIVGYVAASIAGGFAYVFLLAAAIQVTGAIAVPSELSATEQFWQLIGFAWIATLITAAVAFIPSIPVVIALLLLRRSDPFSWAIAGIAVGVASVFVARRIPYLDKLEVSWLILVAGAIAGLVYWLIAGRSPGVRAANE